MMVSYIGYLMIVEPLLLHYILVYGAMRQVFTSTIELEWYEGAENTQ